MKKATIIIDVNDMETKKMGDQWLKKYRKRLTFKSGNEGCGCCVEIYYITAERDIINMIPEELLGSSSRDESPPDETYAQYLKNEKDAQFKTKQEDQWIATYRAANQAFRKRYFSQVIQLLEPYEKKLDAASRKKLEYARKISGQ